MFLFASTTGYGYARTINEHDIVVVSGHTFTQASLLLLQKFLHVLIE